MRAGRNVIDYTTVTESPGLKATQEQVKRLYQRYRFAYQFVIGKDALEVACGCGIGLGYLASAAREVVGVDIEKKNCRTALKNYDARTNVHLKLMDAHDLKFCDESFDLVLLFEAIYYLRAPDKFISEARRVLRKKGRLVICSVNRDWADFHPSPYTYTYFSVPDLYDLLKTSFNEVDMFGGFPVDNKGFKNRLVSVLKRAAVTLNLIPESLKMRAYLKRIFMGKLVPLPREVYDGMVPYELPLRIAHDRPCNNFKIIYAIAEK